MLPASSVKPVCIAGGHTATRLVVVYFFRFRRLGYLGFRAIIWLPFLLDQRIHRPIDDAKNPKCLCDGAL